LLAEHHDAQGDGDDWVDVGGHQGSPGADLDDEHRHQREPRRRTRQTEHGDRRQRRGRGQARGEIERRHRRQDNGRQSKACAHRRARVEVEELSLEDHRAGRVADRGDQDRCGTEQGREPARGVDADQQNDSEQAYHQSNQAQPTDALGMVKAQRQ
jgi:hypothetical protein